MYVIKVGDMYLSKVDGLKCIDKCENTYFERIEGIYLSIHRENAYRFSNTLELDSVTKYCFVHYEIYELKEEFIEQI